MAKTTPYARRGDFSFIGPALASLVAVVLIALLTLGFMRSGPSELDNAASADIVAQMDAAQLRNDAKREEVEKARMKGL